MLYYFTFNKIIFSLKKLLHQMLHLFILLYFWQQSLTLTNCCCYISLLINKNSFYFKFFSNGCIDIKNFWTKKIFKLVEIVWIFHSYYCCCYWCYWTYHITNNYKYICIHICTYIHFCSFYQSNRIPFHMPIPNGKFCLSAALSLSNCHFYGLLIGFSFLLLDALFYFTFFYQTQFFYKLSIKLI